MNTGLYTGYIAVVLSSVFFGCAPLSTKLLTSSGATPLMLVCIRFIMMVPACGLMWLIAPKTKTKLTLKLCLQVLFLSVTGGVLTSSLLFSSYNLMDTGLCTTCHFCYPAFVLLISAVFYRERITLSNVICLALCMTGIGLFLTIRGGVSVTGIVLALASGVAFATYIVYMDKSGIVKKLGLYRFSCLMYIPGSIIMLVIVYLLGELNFYYYPGEWGLIILFGIITGIVAMLLFQYGIGKIGGRRTSILSTLEPVTSIVLGAAVLSEALTAKNVIGCVLVLVASILLVVLDRKREKISSGR